MRAASLGFELTETLARQLQLLGDRFEHCILANVDAEAFAQSLALLCSQLGWFLLAHRRCYGIQLTGWRKW
jgi:hypothetical protein